MRWIISLIIGFAAFGFGYWYMNRDRNEEPLISPIGQLFEKSLEKYSFERLAERARTGSQIVFDQATATTSAYTVWTFHYDSDGKKVTGLAHLPASDSGDQSIKPYQKDGKQFPVIVQFRGYVDKTMYTPGVGTERSAEILATNGFISLAPDFLGYGGSDMPSENIFEERFQTYTAALDLLASVPSLPIADANRIGIWGHSNGGQIALALLEITGIPYPTTLWAPVSKPFPYSILYYTDEADDHGKFLRKKLAEFEHDYDVEKYSLTNYFDRITAPILLHQGSADDAVPAAWSALLVKHLKETGKDITYFVYPGADHNLVPSWNTVIERDREFFRNKLR